MTRCVFLPSNFRSSLVPIAAVALLLSACSKDTKPEAEEPRVTPVAEHRTASNGEDPNPNSAKPPPAQGKALGEATAESASDKYSEATFDLSILPLGAYKAGQSATLEIVLSSKDPYHVNEKYPYKFKLGKADGVKFEKPVVTADALKLEKKRAVMTVAFTPEASGKKRIAGQFSFSVCSEDKCLIEKRDLSLVVDVD